MTEEQNKEVMRLADEIADYAWREGVSDGAYTNAKDDRECRADSRTELEAYLRTIWIASQASNTFPINPNGASKWARLQKHDGAEAIGVVFRTGSGSVGSLVDGRVVWADWLAHPNGSKPESVNAELLEALKECMKWQAEGEFGDPLSEEYWSPAYKEFMGKTKEAIARAAPMAPSTSSLSLSKRICASSVRGASAPRKRWARMQCCTAAMRSAASPKSIRRIPPSPASLTREGRAPRSSAHDVISR